MMHYGWSLAIVVIASCMVFGEIPNDTIMVEGDIALTPEQYQQYQRRRSHKKNYMATPDENKRWKNATIWYTVAMTYFNGPELEEMLWALSEFEKETCLKFRVAKRDTPNYVMVRLGNGGCSAQLGLSYNVPHAQFVNLGSGCRHYGLFLHEFGHAIGLHHEHQHHQRQLNIIYKNIEDNMKIWFEPLPEPYLTFGAPYDVQSIMHYGENAFAARSDLISMKTKDPRLQKYLIPVWLKDMSFYDAWKINAMYKCASHCNVKCPEDTFVDKNCKCVNKRDFAQRRCIDKRSDCAALRDKCESQKHWMWKTCRKTCQKCYEAI